MKTTRRLIKTLLAILLLLIAAATDTLADKNSLAIFNFRPTNIEAMGYNGDILYALISALGMEGSVELMPRRVMEEQLFQAGLTQSDNPDTALKAGKVLGTNFVLYGQVTKSGSGIHSVLHLMDIQSKQEIKSWNLTFGGREAILDRVPEFAKELIQTITNKERYVAVPRTETESLIDIRNLKARSEGKKVVLTWEFDPSQPISSFNIYRSESAGGPYQSLGKTNRNLYEDATIKMGRTYYYRVGLLLHSGMENKSKHTAEVRNAGEKLPYPPLIISNKGYIRRTEIKFVPSLQNDQEGFKIRYYEVMRKQDTGDGWLKIQAIDAKKRSKYELSFVVKDKNLEDGKSYTYAVVSVDKRNRRSPLSDQYTVETTDRPVLVLAKDDLLRKIMFGWQPLRNVEGYNLYRKPESGSWERAGKIRGANRDQYTDERRLDDGKDYLYYLTAFDGDDETGPSKTVRAKTKDLPPYPENIAARGGMVKSVWLSWTPVEDPDVGGYAIYRGTRKNALKLIDKVKGFRSLSYMDKGAGFENLEDGTDYYYSVVSYNLFGAEGSNPPEVHARTKPRPATVRGLNVSATEQHYIIVKWDGNPEPDIAQYTLFRNKNGGYWSKVRDLVSGETAYRDYDLKPGTTYGYKIIAEDKDGLKSDPAESNPIASPVVKTD